MRYLLVVLTALAVIPASAGVIASSSFTSNAESWTGVTANPGSSFDIVLTPAVAYHSTGGNPGGYIALLDPDGNDTMFSAPSPFLGNLSSILNGSISYSTITDQTPDYSGALVVIKGGGLVLVYFTGSQPAVQGQWAAVTVPVAPGANWHLRSTGGSVAALSDFQTALANVTSLYITAENHNGTTETTGLDTVALNAPDIGTPEPSSMMLTAGGLALATALSSRRRRRS
jgi:hypothetical protein